MALQVTLTATTANSISSLLYRAWANAYDANKRVKEMKNDGSKDWALFQIERLKNAATEENATKAALDEFQNQLPSDFLTSGRY